MRTGWPSIRLRIDGSICLDVQSLSSKGDLIRRDAGDGQQILPGELLRDLHAFGTASLLTFLISGKRKPCEDHERLVQLLLLAIGNSVQSVVFDQSRSDRVTQLHHGRVRRLTRTVIDAGVCREKKTQRERQVVGMACCARSLFIFIQDGRQDCKHLRISSGN